MKNMKKLDWKNMDIKHSVGKFVDKVKSSDTYKRPLAIAIAAALIVSAAGAGTCSIISAHHTKTVQAMRAYVESPDLQEQDETVYVIANADGGVKKVIVSDWQKDSSKNNTIADVKTLEELEKSDAENGYSINADTANSWDADGSTFQNVSNGSDLPINVQLSYSLDGQKMTANEIAGKSGKVKIRFDYTNNQKQTVSIDGKDTDIYVPFTVVTGTILDGANFKNVEVSNGKVINDGSRSVVMGFALPGMQESLGLDGDALDLPSYIEITADVTNFELTTTLTMVSNDFFNQAVNDAEDKKKDSSNLSLDSLSSGINQLVDGSAALYDGTSQLLDKSSLLIDGVNQLTKGSQELQTGIITVESALQLICSNNAQLQSGATTLCQNMLNSISAQVNSQLGTNVAFTLNAEQNEQIFNALSAALPTMVDSVTNQKMAEYAKMAAAASGSSEEIAIEEPDNSSNETDSSVTTEPDPNSSDTAETNETEGESTEESSATDTQPTQESSDDSETPNTEQEDSKQEKTADDNSSNNNADAALLYQKVRAGVEAELKTQLATIKENVTMIVTFYNGIYDYTNSVKQVYEGTGQLKDGATQLTNGLNDLQSGTDALVDGITQLNNGAMQLSDGMQQLSGSNLAKLLGASSGVSLSDINARFDAMRDVSAAYNSYTGNADSTGVKFIYRTDSVSADSSQ